MEIQTHDIASFNCVECRYNQKFNHRTRPGELLRIICIFPIWMGGWKEPLSMWVGDIEIDDFEAYIKPPESCLIEARVDDET